MKFKLLVLLSWSTAASVLLAELPNGYEAVDSVTANGAQYIDTGISAQEGLVADVTFMYTRNVNKCVLGAGAMTLPTPANAAINRKYRVTTTFSGSSGADKMYLFARNGGGTAADLAWARVYAVKLTLGETVLRDFVPCRETSTGKLGLYDQQNGGFYPSEGDKPFFMPWRAGVYGGLGGTGSVFELYRLVDRSPEVELVNISAEMAQEGSVFGRVDMIVMPGGSSKDELASLGAAGQANLISYIRNGGTYYGTCAGSHLVLEDELNISGYTRDSYYDGGAQIDIAINAAGMQELGLPKDTWSVRYHRGPFIVDGSPVAGADLKVWGIYTNTDIVAESGPDNRMEGKYAVLAGNYFNGKMLVIASHPESHAANYPFIRQSWRWLSGRDDITTETETMGGYVNGRTNIFYVGTYSDGIYPIVETMLKVDVDPRMNLVAASGLKTEKYQPTARALVADTAFNAAPYQRSDYKTAMDAFKLNGGLVLVAEDCASKDELWELVDGIANDRRAETSVAWGEGRALTFEGDRKLKGLDLRLSAAEEYSTTFANGEISFEADENRLGGDWAYCGAGALHRVIVSNARVSAVYGNHYRDSFYSVTASGGKYTYTPVASNRFEIALGSRNVADGPAVIAFERELVIAKGSTLAIDARGMPKGTYRIFEAGTLSVKEANFTSKAAVTVDEGFLYSLEQEGDAIVLKLADGAALYKVDYVESTGTQYIDTGIDMQDKMTIDLDFMWTSFSGGDSTSYGGMFGVYCDSTYRFYAANFGSARTWRGAIETAAATVYGTFPTVAVNTRYHVVTTVDGTKESQTIGETTKTLNFTAAQTQHPYSCYLFAYHNNDKANGRLPSRLYGAKVYTNLTVLARDYRPCYRPATDTYGLYDMVTKTFFPSAQGSFTGAAVPVDPEPIDPPPVDPDAWKKLYQPVEYIQSTGSQFVNTGLTVQNKVKLDIDWMWTGPFLNYSVLMGGYNTEGNVAYRQYLGYATTTGDWRAITENSATSKSSASVPELGEPVKDVRQHLVQSVNGKVVSFSLDGVEASKTCSYAQTEHQAPLYLFGHRTTDDALAGATSMRLYAAKVYTNLTVLARDYVPCREKATGRFGLYDHVTETFHPSDSAEGFFGPEEAKGIVFVDYIESTGKQFVDTGINMQDQLTADLAFMWTGGLGKGTVGMFGSYAELGGATYRNYIAYVNASYVWRGAIEDNGLQNTGTEKAAANTKYRFVGTIDGATLAQQLNTSTGSYAFSNPQTTHEQSNYLFGLHYNNSFSSPSQARLYSARIYTNSVAVGERVLARDYRPAFLRATKTYGLYDVVSGEFFPSGSDTPFTGAPPNLPGLILLFR